MRSNSRTSVDSIREAMKGLDQSGDGEPTLAEVVQLSNDMSRAMTAYFKVLDRAIVAEFRDIGCYIQQMKSDIANLQVNELQREHLPAAGRELDAVVSATEEATNAIMECAETMMAADDSDPAAYKATVDAQVMKIFEACSFQDITGQRISKVVEALRFIDTRVSRFADRLGIADAAGHADPEEAARAERKRRLMLDGPQEPGGGIAQDEIDLLLRAG